MTTALGTFLAGIRKPSNVEAVESYSYKQWFQSIYQHILSTVKIVTVTANYSVFADVFYVRVDATAGPITITLPDAELSVGRQILIKKIDSSGNAVTVTCPAHETIEGVASFTLNSQWNYQRLISSGVEIWEKI